MINFFKISVEIPKDIGKLSKKIQQRIICCATQHIKLKYTYEPQLNIALL